MFASTNTVNTESTLCRQAGDGADAVHLIKIGVLGERREARGMIITTCITVTATVKGIIRARARGAGGGGGRGNTKN